MMEQTRSGALPGQGGPVQLLRASRPALRWKFYLKMGLQALMSTGSSQVT